MPALRLFGRKWLAASDDLVFPGLFELAFRLVWLILMAVVYHRYYVYTWECSRGGELVRAYLIGMLALLSVIVLLCAVLVNRSAQGSITDVQARRHVPPLLVVKIGLILPEFAFNLLGTAWAFSDLISCEAVQEHFTVTVIEYLVVFDWLLFLLIIFGFVMVFDPLGSKRYNDLLETPGETIRHRKVTSVWQRRFRWLFCWIRNDEHGTEAFSHVAGILSSLFRGTDLVPSDIMAGSVLLRVEQKKRTRDMRRIQMVTETQSKYSTDLNKLFATTPKWMNLEYARHFLRLSMAAYGWPFLMYQHCATGFCRLLPKLSCCGCFRRKTVAVTDDNCCLCNLAGFKYMSQIDEECILFASFRNHIFELPFCVIADHKTSSIVVALRGSISLRDIFTDFTAASDRFDVEGMPPDTTAHRGMIAGANYVERRLQEADVLDKALAKYTGYSLIITGHSLGAGVAALLGIKLRPKYADLKVYAFAIPAGLISRDAARLTESFVFTVGVGDDLVMRLGVDSIENLRTNLLQVLRASRLPKYRILLNGCGYALFGVPSGDLESTWKDETGSASQSPLLNIRPIQTVAASCEAALLSKDISVRRYSKTRLFTAGRILHITHRKKTKAERKKGTGGPSFEMRWAAAEDFMELRVMPRMLLDHLPENVYATLEIIVNEQVERRERFTTITV